jgi:ferric-dicitrate binding protein FerR (iron transport regulator)
MTTSPGDELRPMRGLTSVEDPATVAARRPALVALMEREIGLAHERKRRAVRRRPWLGSGMAALAAAGLLALFVRSELTRGGADQARSRATAAPSAKPAAASSIAAPAADEPFLEGSHLGLGSELRTEAKGAHLALGERVRVDLAEHSRLRLTQLDAARHVVELARGRVDVEVARRAGIPREFAVESPDSLVEVKGTGFTVEVRHTSDGRPFTSVEVRHGLVVVTNRGERHELSAGMTFVSEPDAATRPAGTTSPATTAISKTASAEPGNGASPPRPAASPESTLSEQNSLFERALAARDHGNDAEAIRLFGELCRRYPSSPLWGVAQDELRRAQLRLGSR